MIRTFAICVVTMILCTMLGAAIYVVPHWDDPSVHSDSDNCMVADFVDGIPGALVGGILCGGGGFLVSLVLGPTLVAADTHVRQKRMEFDALQVQAQNSSQSLLRGSSVPMSLQKAELLRATQAGSPTSSQQLLRSAPPKDFEHLGER